MNNVWKASIAFVAFVALAAAAVGFVSAQTEEGDGTPLHQRPGIFEGFKARLAENLGVTEDEFDAAVDETANELIDEALAEGLIDEEQAEHLRERIEEGGFPGPGFRHHHRGGHLIGQVAEYLEMEPQDVIEALDEDTTLADVIEANGGSVDEFVAGVIAQLDERLSQAVADGKIDEDRKAEALANAEEKIVDALNGELPMPKRPFGGPDGGAFPPPDAPEDEGISF